MRLKLILEHRPAAGVPIDYPYLISAWIYRTIGEANSEFARWLHEQGYRYGGRKYKLFTYGPLQPMRYRIDKGEFILSEGPTELIMSFHLEEAVERLVTGLFLNQHFSLGDRVRRADFSVRSMEVLSKPAFANTMRFRTLTPLCISQDEPGERYAQYRHPEDEGYGELLLQNLVRKRLSIAEQTLEAFETSKVSDYHFRLLSAPRSKLFHIKGTQVRGYLYDFEISAPVDLLKLGYFAGFGEKNSSLGMGCVDIV